MTLLNITEQLINDLYQLKEQFYLEQHIDDEKSFFSEVKEATEPIFQRLHAWEEETLSHIQQQKSAVHLKQVIATKENIELLIVHGYFKDMRKRRFMEYYQSSLFVLNNLKEELRHEQ